MTRLFTALAITLVTPIFVMSPALGASPSGKAQIVKPSSGVAHGRAIFASYGCYQCHGYQGQGTGSGSKLAPGMLPIEAFTHQLRNPRNLMPVYTVRTVSESDVKDIYAYLQTIPKAKTVAEIPLLNSN